MVLSVYIIAVAIAWVVAQGTKYVLAVIRTRSTRNFRQLYRSGKMPSAHSASVVALVTVIAGIDGVMSPVFAVAALFAAIVMYDAVMVRRSSGEQGEALVALLRSQPSNKISLPRVAKGHTPLEVGVGALVGLIVGLGVLAVHGSINS